MAKAAIVRTSDNRLQCFFHAPDTGVCVRVHENGGWGKPHVLLHGARETFSVNMAEDGRLYVFAQDAGGSMHLCTSNTQAPSGWNDQTILRSQMSVSQGACFHALISGAGLQLIYNIPSGEGRGQQLVSQRLGADSRWGVANRLGDISPIGGQLFQTQTVGKGHMLLFYQSCDPDCALGYREVAPDRIGDMHTLHTTGYQITDASFLTTADALHALYIVKSPFSCQLIYRRRDSAGLSDPAVIWEAQRADNCLLFFAENKLTASCVSGGQVFSCTANDSFVFSRPVRVRTSFATEPMKAVYLSEPPMQPGAFFCREVYVDKARPWELQLLNIQASDFYPLHIQLDLPPSAPVQTAPTVTQEKEFQAASVAPVPSAPPQTYEQAMQKQGAQEKAAEAIMRMRAQLEKALRENEDKEMRITYLAARLKSYESEKSREEEKTEAEEKAAEEIVEISEPEDEA